jgi:hypothetical protein
MERRFEQRSEAGGEQSGENTSEKLSWKDRLMSRFSASRERTAEQTDEKPEKVVTLGEFFRGIVSGNPETTEANTEPLRSWIDRAFEEREVEEHIREAAHQQAIESMDEHTRQEFFMVVAERFRAAGERFMQVLSRVHGEEVTISKSQEEEALPGNEPSQPKRGAEFETLTIPEVAIAPPFEFAEAGLNNSQIASVESNQPASEDVPLAERVISGSDYTPIVRQEVIRDGDVTTYVEKTRLRDVLFSASLMSSREKKLLERKIEREVTRKQKHIFEAQLAAIKKASEASQRTATSKIQDVPSYGPKPATEALKPTQKLKKQLEQPQKRAENPIASVNRQYETQITQPKEIDELEFAKLKAAPRTPEKIPPQRVSFEVAEVRSPQDSATEQIERRDFTNRYYAGHSQQNTHSQTPSAQEIIGINSTTSNPSSYKSAKTLNERLHQRYDISTQSGVNNWVATGAILALILICAIFVSAV